MTYFWADTHFNHEGILHHAARPYGSVVEMNETLIALWNGRVEKEGDDVWVLGPHRLMCGDSLESPAALDALLMGQPVDMVLTDPPYAIYGSSTGVSSDIAANKMICPFFASVWVTIRSRLAEFGHNRWWGALTVTVAGETAQAT